MFSLVPTKKAPFSQSDSIFKHFSWWAIEGHIITGSRFAMQKPPAGLRGKTVTIEAGLSFLNREIFTTSDLHWIGPID